MAEVRTIAVILLWQDNPSTTAPSLEDCRRLLETSVQSLTRYWRDTSENWFELSYTYFGPYTRTLPPPSSIVDGQSQRLPRRKPIDIARTAAQDDGHNLGGFDGTIVFLAPGAVAGEGYDAGASGMGNGSSLLLPVKDSHTFFAHEFGHLLGFNHSYGLLNEGGDWTNDGVTQLFNVYGDPYDIMSASSFGKADPQSTTTVTEIFQGFPAAQVSGPMLSRAYLHYFRPAALEAAGKVRHITAPASQGVTELHPAGEGAPGTAELLVYHPRNEDGEARGRLYVEYRQPDTSHSVGRWDTGLAEAGADRDRRGLIIHEVKEVPGSGEVVVWYSGRIVFPSFDTDVTVPTTFGSVTVQVAAAAISDSRPPTVKTWIVENRPPHVTIEETTSDQRVVVSSEKRPIPGWDFAPEFTWEVVDVTTTAAYRPLAQGVGGPSPAESGTAARLRWYVGGTMLTESAGSHTVNAPDDGRQITVYYSVDPETYRLVLINDPADGRYEIAVDVATFEASFADGPTASTRFAAQGRTEGWGQDYEDYMDVWDRVTHPIPKRKFGPPEPDVFVLENLQLLRGYGRLLESSPGAAEALKPLVLDQSRVLRSLASQHR